MTIIISDLQTEARVQFGDDIDLTETSPMQQFIEVLALEQFNLWEQMEAHYYSAFVDFATSTNLDRIGELVNILRNSSVKARGQVTFNGTNGTTIPLGTTVMTTDNIEFVTDVEADIAGGSTAIDITAVLPGADGNVSGSTITELKTPIAGVTTISNASPMTGGTDLEEDAAYRTRIKNAMIVQGKGTLEAIRQAILAVDSVTSCSASEDTDAHSATFVVSGASVPNQDVDDAIEETRPAGIYCTWSVPTSKPIYVDITVSVNSNAPGDAAAQVRTALYNYIVGLGVGNDVIYSKLFDVVFDAEEDEATPWIVDITVLTVGLSDAPVGVVNVVIAAGEEATTTNDDTFLTTVINVV